MIWKSNCGWKRWHYDAHIKRADLKVDIMMCKLREHYKVEMKEWMEKVAS